MGIKEDLHRLIDGLADDDAAEVLEYIRWLRQDGEALSAEEMKRAQEGEAQIARGEFVTLDEMKRELGQ